MLTDQQEDLLVAVALIEFSAHYEQADPELAEQTWQLAADRLVNHDIGLLEVLKDSAAAIRRIHVYSSRV